MSVTREGLKEFWNGILEDEEAKLADRMKAAENLAKLLEPQEAEEAPERLVVVYR